MAAARNEHLVVIMLEPLPLGQEFEIWERHITIVPWFPCDDAGRLDRILSDAAGRHRPFTVKAGQVEEWGNKEKFKVQKIETSDELNQLHWTVFRSLEDNGFPIHQKDFMGEKYLPHIALRNKLQKGSPLKRGSEISINAFTLIKQDRFKGSGRMIKSAVKNYELG